MTTPIMKLKPVEIKAAWQFKPQNNQGQPSFVHVTTAMHGPRAIAIPPPAPGGYAATFHLAPTDWLIQLADGQWTQINAHAAALLLEEETDG